MDIKKLTVTAEVEARQRQGARYIEPGVWIDPAGGLHVSLPEMLAARGLADTPENQQSLIEALTKAFETQAPTAEIVLQDQITQ